MVSISATQSSADRHKPRKSMHVSTPRSQTALVTSEGSSTKRCISCSSGSSAFLNRDFDVIGASLLLLAAERFMSNLVCQVGIQAQLTHQLKTIAMLAHTWIRLGARSTPSVATFTPTWRQGTATAAATLEWVEVTQSKLCHEKGSTRLRRSQTNLPGNLVRGFPWVVLPPASSNFTHRFQLRRYNGGHIKPPTKKETKILSQNWPQDLCFTTLTFQVTWSPYPTNLQPC